METWMWYLIGAGVIALIVLISGLVTRCSSCKKWWAIKFEGREEIDRQEKMGLIFVTYRNYYQCKNCQYKWMTISRSEEEMTKEDLAKKIKKEELISGETLLAVFELKPIETYRVWLAITNKRLIRCSHSRPKPMGYHSTPYRSIRKINPLVESASGGYDIVVDSCFQTFRRKEDRDQAYKVIMPYFLEK